MSSVVHEANSILLIIPSLPLLGICRGFHEMNVALGGGTLHQKLHDIGKYIEHREDIPKGFQVAMRRQVSEAQGA